MNSTPRLLRRSPSRHSLLCPFARSRDTSRSPIRRNINRRDSPLPNTRSLNHLGVPEKNGLGKIGRGRILRLAQLIAQFSITTNIFITILITIITVLITIVFITFISIVYTIFSRNNIPFINNFSITNGIITYIIDNLIVALLPLYTFPILVIIITVLTTIILITINSIVYTTFNCNNISFINNYSITNIIITFIT